MKPPMKRRLPLASPWCGRCWERNFLGNDGSVAVEVGLTGGLVLVPLMLGILQYGLFFDATQGLAAATRIGAEYARDSTTCQSGINPIVVPPTVSGSCMTGIQNAMQNSMNFSPALASPTITVTCECEPTQTSSPYQACSVTNNLFDSCFTNPPPGYTGPNRIFLRISVSQPFIPFIPLLPIPTTLNSTTDLRIQ
jgi:TadE-like protein